MPSDTVYILPCKRFNIVAQISEQRARKAELGGFSHAHGTLRWSAASRRQLRDFRALILLTNSENLELSKFAKIYQISPKLRLGFGWKLTSFMSASHLCIRCANHPSSATDKPEQR